ncbi:PA2778 family cysteine peptidase [Dechloromonas sp. XY25]|uniref:PA2778 family cysteine peptidase n=1 Tax=Dechloromonas hankyongensis TaxID=2908002 RepID=A0ABS9K137_9RHOO|nr:PA2778 family cysteine peptidase [Dechloromonas hankyongensis]MCG2576863.1 PA2778 family cysteine peptidase [Dechloromonas hankyongensis]
MPFHPQEAYQCGPAALATALASVGIRRSPDQLRDEVYIPARQGSLQPEMLAAVRRAGAIPYRLAPEPQALLKELAAGHPVVVLQNLRFDWAPQWHYAVAVGYDLPAGQVILRSGVEKRLVMDLGAFDRSWAKAGRWAFVALPPEQLPAAANETDYVAAAVALERVVPEAAEKAYGTALKTWPGNLLARIGIGNAAYRRGDLAAAEAAFRQAVDEHPASGDAWNNLAQTLHERGNQPAAREAAERAVAIGGPRLPIYRQTFKTVSGG